MDVGSSNWCLKHGSDRAVQIPCLASMNAYVRDIVSPHATLLYVSGPFRDASGTESRPVVDSAAEDVCYCRGALIMRVRVHLPDASGIWSARDVLLPEPISIDSARDQLMGADAPSPADARLI